MGSICHPSQPHNTYVAVVLELILFSDFLFFCFADVDSLSRHEVKPIDSRDGQQRDDKPTVRIAHILPFSVA